MLKIEKYGGSSVMSIDKIKMIAAHLKNEVSLNNKVIVVFSAMGKTTNMLLDEAYSISNNPNLRELDALLSIGEQKSVCLGAIALSDLGVKCISLNAKDINIRSTNKHTDGLIISIDKEKLEDYLANYDVVFVCGFQGINQNGDYVTLGRGGSDTTAVALSVVTNSPCYIYTDVNKVYSFDPNIIKNVKQYDKIAYEIMIEMASLGSGVLITRSVLLAYINDVELHLAKSLDKEGTKVVKNMLENDIVKGISRIDNLINIKMKLDDYLNIYDGLKDHKIDMFNLLKDNVSFVLKKEGFNKLKELTNDFIFQNNVTKISLVGCGIASRGNNITKLINVLTKNNILVDYISTSEFAISFIAYKDSIDVIKILCEEFDLLQEDNI